MNNYKALLNKNKIQSHQTSKNEINGLLSIAERDLNDAKIEGLSNDRAFAPPYNAALQPCTIILAKSGFRTRGTAHHQTTFDFIEMAPVKKFHSFAVYFNQCRRERNTVDYDRSMVVSALY